ncbi:MAG: PmbA protein, partial [Myxococcota bacterium]
EPFLEGAWGSRRFDGEGISSKRRPIIENGVLKTYFVDTYYGKKLDMAPTGGTSNLVFNPGAADLDTLCAQVGDAILITGFLGGNSNGTTGDFSHGFDGFLIKDGKRAQPLAGMNIAGNHTELWKTLEAIGSDVYLLSPLRAPSLLFAPQMVAGK